MGSIHSTSSKRNSSQGRDGEIKGYHRKPCRIGSEYKMSLSSELDLLLTLCLSSLDFHQAEESKLAEEEKRLNRILALHTLGDQIEIIQKRISKRKKAISEITQQIDEARGPTPETEAEESESQMSETEDSEIRTGQRRATRKWVVSTALDSYD